MEDPVDNQNPFNEAFDEDEFDYDSTAHIFVVKYIMFTVELVATILGLSSCGLCSYVICKFKLLQTRTNYILLNCFICMIIRNIVWITSMLTHVFDFCNTVQERCLRILQLDSSLIMVSYLLFALLAFDWYLSVSGNTLFSKYNKVYKLILVSLYLLGMVNFFSIRFAWFSYGNSVAYFMCSVVVIILYVNRSITAYPPEALKISYALTISSVYFLMGAPIMVFIATSRIVTYVCPDETFTASTTALNIVFAFLIIENFWPLVIAIVLRKLDKKFKTSFDYVFRRSVRKYNRTSLNLEDTEDFTDSEVA